MTSTKRAAAVALLAVVGGTAALVVRSSTADGIVVRAFRSDPQLRHSLLEVTSRRTDADRPIAFLVHGFQCNSSMMMPLARALAANGVDAYALDLPGHGASREPFSEARSLAATLEALESVTARTAVARERIVLVGHSYGANVLARIIAEDPRYRTAVLIGPSYEGGLSPESPVNLLVLTAEHDPERITGFAREMLHDATGASIDAPGAFPAGSSIRGARAWSVLPDVGHVSMIFSPAAHARVAHWIQMSLGNWDRQTDGRGLGSPIALAILILASAVALAASGARLYAVRVVADARRPLSSAARLALIGLGAFAVSVVLARHATPLAALRLAEGERIASLVATAGALMNVSALVMCRTTPLPTGRQIARGLPVALGSFALVYGGAVVGADGELYRMSLTDVGAERQAAAAVLAAGFVPFFAYIDGMAEAVRRALGGGLAGGTGAIAANAVAWVLVAAALPLVDVRLGRFAVSVLAVAIPCVVIGGILTRATRNPAVGPMYSSATIGWIIAVGFVTY